MGLGHSRIWASTKHSNPADEQEPAYTKITLPILCTSVSIRGRISAHTCSDDAMPPKYWANTIAGNGGPGANITQLQTCSTAAVDREYMT